MEPLERIRSLIDGFAGYDTTYTRRLADEQARAYAGERLSALREREAQMSEDGRSRVEGLLLRAEFMNQRAFHGFDEEASAEQIRAVAAADAQLLDAADALDLDAVERAFDARDAAMRKG